MERRPEEASGSGRVSPTAPDIASPSFQVWNEALQDPSARKALDVGLAEVAEGKTRPWSEIRRRPAR